MTSALSNVAKSQASPQPNDPAGDELPTGVHRAAAPNVTSVVIPHDMASVFRIADRISMLYNRGVLLSGTVDHVRDTDIEYVRRFITISEVSGGVSGAFSKRNQG